MFGVAIAALLAASPASLSEARKLFERGRFEEALTRLDALALSKVEPEQSNVQLLRARCLSALGRDREVDGALALALSADPETTFGSTQVPPSLVDRLTSLRLLSRGYLDVSVAGLEPGDVIEVDGTPFAEGNALSIGKHAIQIRSPSGSTRLSTVAVVRPGQTARVAVSIPPSAKKEPVPVPVIASDPTAPAPAAPIRNVAVFVRTRVDMVAPFASSTPLVMMGELGATLLVKWFRAGVFGFVSGGSGLGARLGLGMRLGRLHLQAFAESLLTLNRIGATLGGLGSIGFSMTERLEFTLEAGVHGILYSQKDVVRVMAPLGLSLSFFF